MGGAIAGAGFYVGHTYDGAALRADTLMASLHEELTADKLHETLRGVVYRALYGAMTSDDNLKANADAEVQADATAFRKSIQNQKSLDLPTDVRQAMDKLDGPLEGFVTAAIKLVAAAKAGNTVGATAMLPDFNTAYRQLQTGMEGVSQLISAVSRRSRQDAQWASELAQISYSAALALVLLMAGSLLYFSRRFVTRPLSGMTGTMLRLSDGDTDVEIEERQAITEIGAMAKSLGVFREALISRVALTRAADAAVEADRQKAVESTEMQQAVAEAVMAAGRGDFSQRVPTDFAQEGLNVLAGSVNNLLETVERGLGDAGRVLSALANTDLTKRVEGAYEGAFLTLKQDTNSVANRLVEVITQLRTTSRGVKTATSEILAGANDLSERTTRQAATIEETSAAMEQLAATVVQNAKRASEASSNSTEFTRSAEEGGQVMHQATMAMEKITGSSSRISSIIGLIDDIAFQTNLLALNASVEAARAGEAGKGFAVVAVEVRRLAQSAAEASKEIKVLIDQSVGEVTGGSRLVEEAAVRLTKMLEAARANNGLMEGIARASREQASAIEEVTVSVRQLDEMTQHNAALVEQTNAAIEQTENQASELDRIVDVFTLDGRSGARSQPLQAVAPAGVGKTPADAAPAGLKGLPSRVKSAAKAYFSHGNAAVEADWTEF
jgi:methyl-accepting chemotaxis protein